MASSSSFKITFLGGANAIGASCALVEVAQTRVLIDCGARFDPRNPLPDLSQLTGKPLDAILVTHAHTDHTGALPVVYEAFAGVPVYATPPTMDLLDILLRDALKLMSRPEREGEMALYTGAQMNRLLENLVPVHHGQSIRAGEVEATFLPASHILGASMIHLSTPAGSALFTGDYSVSAQLTVPALARPSVEADIVVSEATYGERLHEDRNVAEQRLVEQITTVVIDGGRVLIPAFAVGRAQEILLILKRALRKKDLPEVPVFVDGMVRAVCGVYGRHERYVSRLLAHEIRHTGHPFYTDSIRPVERAEDRQNALQSGPSIIVASSGMLSGGASLFYARELVRRERDAILLTGYQDEESPGRALLNLAEEEGPRQIRLGEDLVDVRCRFDKYGLSAHADRMQMIA
jgi:Cft2 family RNA processing exonuclease